MSKWCPAGKIECESLAIEHFCGKNMWRIEDNIRCPFPDSQRPIAPEPCPNCGEIISPCVCMRNKCNVCGEPVGNITFTCCDKCWDDKYKQIAPEPQTKLPDIDTCSDCYKQGKIDAVEECVRKMRKIKPYKTDEDEIDLYTIDKIIAVLEAVKK